MVGLTVKFSVVIFQWSEFFLWKYYVDKIIYVFNWTDFSLVSLLKA